MNQTDNFRQLAIAYVDKHKDKSGWVDKMIAYYTTPSEPFRLHEYTELVLEYLYEVKG